LAANSDHNFSMVDRSAAAPSRLLQAVEPLPAASRLKPPLLLALQAFDAASAGRVE
jgi:hypothetical protein